MIFSDLNLPEDILKAVDDIGFSEPTEIQERAIPNILEGRDVTGKSRTGTGKTAAFSIPAIINVNEENKKNISTLILCPTRELAMQVCEEIKKYSKYKKIVKVLPIYGGQSYDRQISGLKNGANIIVGTPGRVIDHINRRTLKLNNLKTIILDEADEMLNMGFKEDIETILEKATQREQTILFSATMPPDILKITKQYQKDPVFVDVKTDVNTTALITQYYCNVPKMKKLDTLNVLLRYVAPKLSIIFCNTKKMVDELESSLNMLGFNAAGLHGDMKQNIRTTVMSKFKNGKVSILIATDVAARGIDVTGVDAVFNYDIPQDVEYYVHRIGRTGRAGKEGQSFTIINGNGQFRDLAKIKKETNANLQYFKVPTPEVVKNKNNIDFASKIIGLIDDNIDSTMYDYLVEQGCTGEQIAKAVLNYIAPKEKKIPYVENLKDMNTSSVGGGGGESKPRVNRSSQGYKQVEISLGRKDGISPNHIVGAIAEATGIRGNNIGKINILPDSSIVEVPDQYLDITIEKVNKTKINGLVVSVKAISVKKETSSFKPRKNNFTSKTKRPKPNFLSAKPKK
ncbi:MAG: DEAD/DEAH box helicase [Oscillospiraceae bacterium]